MNNRITKTLRAKAGFTLVELIVVIAILGILAGVGAVGYSGYIKKADEAADQQLLGFVNQAFAAACAENGEDARGLDETPSLELTGDVGAKAIGAVSVHDEDFQKYLGADRSVFKVITALYFDSANGVFKDVAESIYASLTFNKDDLDAVKLSAFYTADGLGVSGLMDKVDFVSTLAASLVDWDTQNGAYQLIGASVPEMMGKMGFTESDIALDDPNNEFTKLVAQKIDLIDWSKVTGSATMSFTDKQQYAMSEMAANYAVLRAAEAVSEEDDTTILESFKTSTNFKDLIKADDTDASMSKAAMFYGLYTAYAYSIEDETERNAAIAKANDPMTLLEGVNDDGFKTYLATDEAKTDLEGYRASMSMIKQSSEDKAAVSNLMVNGFSDPALIALLGQAIG